MQTTTRRADRDIRPSRPRSRAAVVVLVLLGLVQLFVAAVVPFAEAKTPSKLGTHIEQRSDRRHYVHDETYCSACMVRHLGGATPASVSPPVDVPRVSGAPASAPRFAPDAERRDPLAARAPPAPVLLG